MKHSHALYTCLCKFSDIVFDVTISDDTFHVPTIVLIEFIIFDKQTIINRNISENALSSGFSKSRRHKN